MIDIAARFGDNLSRCRRLAGVSQDELSARASVHRTEVSQIERGLRVPRVDTLVKLAASLDVSADELLEGSPGRPAAFATANSPHLRERRAERWAATSATPAARPPKSSG